MSLLLVTTGATSALLVDKGLAAPTFVSCCNYTMLGVPCARSQTLFVGGHVESVFLAPTLALSLVLLR